MNAARDAILLVEDDSLACAAIVRLLKSVTEVVTAGSVAEAREAFGAGVWRGLVVDVTLPDGSGLDWVAEVREYAAQVPILVLTAHCTQEFVNRAFSLRASYLCKPFPPDDLVGFARSASERHADDRKALGGMLERLAKQHQLTQRELEIVRAAAHGVASKEFVAGRGISMNTYKSQVRSVLRKIGATSLGEVRDAMLRELNG